MTAIPTSVSGRAPEAVSSSNEEEPRVPLRLTVARGRLGLELYEPVSLGPLELPELQLSFRGLSFPLDLSGGVPVFRHRRGELERLVLATSVERLRAWIEPRIRAAIGALARPLDLWPITDGLGVGIVRAGSVLAFDLLWAPTGSDVRLVVSRARGVGLTSPALGESLRILDSVFGKLSTRRGRLYRVSALGQRLGRIVLPSVGARAPAAEQVVVSTLAWEHTEAKILLDSTLTPPAVSAVIGRALEAAIHTERADDALASGEIEPARSGYMAALEAAPRARELVLLIAEIDARIAGRREAALGLLSETLPAVAAGAVGAELLAATGDHEGARAAYSAVVRDETYAPLAALLAVESLRFEPDAQQRRLTLDAAVARAPNLPEARWARFRARAERGDIDGALADAQHLEAAAVGSRARHYCCVTAAGDILAAGFERAAGRLFERALRYVPDDAKATLGLGRAFLAAREGLRALPLLERARELAASGAGELVGEIDFELARLSAEVLSDLPQAIARLRQVTTACSLVVEARVLEAQYRLKLGDIVGTSVAYARARELVELGHRSRNPAQWLRLAGRFESEVRRDPNAAERHLAQALRLEPQSAELAEAYRDVAARVAARRQAAELSPVTDSSVPPTSL